uniref:Uncharacterized protein n=1 Tax=Malurus cyaneus samueli TaxID=2593467 RepID=A0A8C5UCN4_9PASS
MCSRENRGCHSSESSSCHGGSSSCHDREHSCHGSEGVVCHEVTAVPEVTPVVVLTPQCPVATARARWPKFRASSSSSRSSSRCSGRRSSSRSEGAPEMLLSPVPELGQALPPPLQPLPLILRTPKWH